MCLPSTGNPALELGSPGWKRQVLANPIFQLNKTFRVEALKVLLLHRRFHLTRLGPYLRWRYWVYAFGIPKSLVSINRHIQDLEIKWADSVFAEHCLDLIYHFTNLRRLHLHIDCSLEYYHLADASYIIRDNQLDRLQFLVRRLPLFGELQLSPWYLGYHGRRSERRRRERMAGRLEKLAQRVVAKKGENQIDLRAV
jgi:hypothetical protein